LSIKISDIGSVRTLVETAIQKGVCDVVLSPGSRNAPLIISFTAIDAFDCISVVDERTAGFMALGMAQQTGKPAILSCTSGSALLNYGPAIAEAYHQRIPLIVIAADRPKEWIGQGEGQSIDQLNVLQGVLQETYELVKESGEDDVWYNRRQAQFAFETAIKRSRPVLINVPMAEPLYRTTLWSMNESSISSQCVNSDQFIGDDLLANLKEKWASCSKIMILVAQHQPDSNLTQQLKIVYEDPRVAVLTETSANLYHFGFVSCIDRTLEMVKISDQSMFVPDLLITIGSNLISKKLKAFLRANKDGINEHWHIGPEMLDTFQSLTHWIDADPAKAIAQVRLATTEIESDFSVRWKGAFFKAEQRHMEFLQTAPYSDLKVFEQILELLPVGWSLQMGNSSVVRYIQLFNQLQGVSYFGNRGVSGIEGCTSTAVGAALKSDKPVLFISGDHAFRYDANGLSFESLPDNLKVIVINNDGGNIFRIIDGPQNQASGEEFIEHTQHKSVQKLVEYHGVEYRFADDLISLDKELLELVDSTSENCRVLEVFTPREKSPDILKSYFNFISNEN
jgi:2-succinyl-5-enolpyruvyl-6-hydroxy-3-cyclohexene-1-carboxylate synthase